MSTACYAKYLAGALVDAQVDAAFLHSSPRPRKARCSPMKSATTFLPPDPMPDEPTPSEIILCQTGDYQTRLEVRFEGDSAWLSQKQMGELFQIGVGTVNHHLKAIFSEGELKPEATIQRYRIVRKRGGGSDCLLNCSSRSQRLFSRPDLLVALGHFS